MFVFFLILFKSIFFLQNLKPFNYVPQQLPSRSKSCHIPVLCISLIITRMMWPYNIVFTILNFYYFFCSFWKDYHYPGKNVLGVADDIFLIYHRFNVMIYRCSISGYPIYLNFTLIIESKDFFFLNWELFFVFCFFWIFFEAIYSF